MSVPEIEALSLFQSTKDGQDASEDMSLQSDWDWTWWCVVASTGIKLMKANGTSALRCEGILCNVDLDERAS